MTRTPLTEAAPLSVWWWASPCVGCLLALPLMDPLHCELLSPPILFLKVQLPIFDLPVITFSLLCSVAYRHTHSLYSISCIAMHKHTSEFLFTYIHTPSRSCHLSYLSFALLNDPGNHTGSRDNGVKVSSHCCASHTHTSNYLCQRSRQLQLRCVRHVWLVRWSAVLLCWHFMCPRAVSLKEFPKIYKQPHETVL